MLGVLINEQIEFSMKNEDFKEHAFDGKINTSQKNMVFMEQICVFHCSSLIFWWDNRFSIEQVALFSMQI